jgi:hypothetical protein
MKRFVILSLLLTVVTIQAQQVQDSIKKASVENNLVGVQIGLVNLSLQYEKRLDREITLRTEAGGQLGYASRETPTGDESTGAITPYLTVEPRWYYGLDRRTRKGRNISNNSSNYLSLQNSYFFESTTLSKVTYKVVPAVIIVPKYGIRRSFAKHFNYEFSFGVGYQYNIFSNETGCTCSHHDTFVDIQARIGYNF